MQYDLRPYKRGNLNKDFHTCEDGAELGSASASQELPKVTSNHQKLGVADPPCEPAREPAPPAPPPRLQPPEQGSHTLCSFVLASAFGEVAQFVLKFLGSSNPLA